ncbi:pirin family protein [Campylobacter californiensis]|uniref:pirin family protein n=1 Tax=Campylobacter californiensis TaxID=1032243 RepID=UPI002AD4AC48|nr:hypothetical protein [Campylobacter sp. RM12916]
MLSPNGDNGSFKIHQDMWLHRYLLQNEELNITLNSARNYWLQVVNGKLNLHEHELGKADGVALNDEILLKIKCEKKSRIFAI